MKIEDLVFVTGNTHKLRQVQRFLGVELKHTALDLEEIQSTDLREIVEHKAKQAYHLAGSPVLVEDVSLEFQAIAPLPGPFVKWFNQVGYDKMCRMLDGFSDRSATARLLYGIYDGNVFKTAQGSMHGHIAYEPSAVSGGFGFDCIFVNDGFSVTRAQMDSADYERTSYRKHGLENLLSLLNADIA